jgi:hypothetical protein
VCKTGARKRAKRSGCRESAQRLFLMAEARVPDFHVNSESAMKDSFQLYAEMDLLQ